MTPQKNFVAHFIILPVSYAYIASMVRQLVIDNLEGFEKKHLTDHMPVASMVKQLVNDNLERFEKK